MSAEAEGPAAGQQQIEIEFVSQLGEVFVAQSDGRWHCGVKLAGEGPSAEGSIQGDGTQSTAYECYEYLSHLLKHDILFRDGAEDGLDRDLETEFLEEATELQPSEAPGEEPTPGGEPAEAKPPPEPKRKPGRRKPGA